MQKKRTGRMLCSLALSAVTLWGVSVTAPAKDARDALRSLKDETLGVMLLRYERGDGGEDFLSLRTSLALHATPLLRDGEENIAQAWSVIVHWPVEVFPQASGNTYAGQWKHVH